MRGRLALGAVGVAVLAALWLGWAARALGRLDAQVEERFQGRLFAVPSTVYGAPLVLYPGLDVKRVDLAGRLERLRYRRVSRPAVDVGEVSHLGDRFRIGRRPFRYPHHVDPGGSIDVVLDPWDRIARLLEPTGREVPLVQIEPEVIAELHGPSRADRRLVRLPEVPPVVIRAILAVEDQRFYEHPGVDLRRMLGAALANLRAVRIVQGASTLTQQLVKNFYLTPERTLRRKLREALMALLLERRHSKEEILEAYLNEVYLGQRGSVEIHGVGEAAFHYFAKGIGEITLPEAALLAGLIKGPSLYSPYTHPEAARERRDLVLQILFEEGEVSEAELAQALEAPVDVQQTQQDENLAPYFVDSLRQDLARVYGEEILQSEGLSIYTTLDPRLQQIANRAVTDGLAALEKRLPVTDRPKKPGAQEPFGPPAPPEPLQGALVALAPRTGEILALVGGRDYGTSQFNRAVQARRQPGSVFKPVVALAALARRNGQPPSHTALSELLDEPLEVETPAGLWQPANYDEEFRGPVTLRGAIEQSLNVPVARLGLEVGPHRIIEVARKLGFDGRLEPVPSIALGVFESSLLEAARAYAVFAAEGMRPELRTYVEVMDAEGQILERKPLEFERAFSPEEVFLVTSLLEGVVDRGTARGLRAMGFEGPVAAKTGTTSGYRDAWFVAYLPDLLVAVWVGFDDERSLGLPGAAAALPIAGQFLLQAVGSDGRAPFSRPPGIVQASVGFRLGALAGPDHPVGEEFFLPGTEPPGAVRDPGVRRLLDWLRGRM